ARNRSARTQGQRPGRAAARGQAAQRRPDPTGAPLAPDSTSRLRYVGITPFHTLLSKHLVFFFSSRRRHTRSKRDWSSDVCSSDLARAARLRRLHEGARKVGGGGREGEGGGAQRARRARAGPAASQPRRPARRPARSEERRVGKECRWRWGRCHEKKKTGRSEKEAR